MDRTSKDIAAILLVAGAVFLTNLGVAHLWDRDEPRNAGCAAEMIQAGDWVTPVFNAELRTHKPVLTYWFMMCSYALLGVSEFSARLPSAVLGMGTCLATYFMGRRLFGRSAGLWSAIVLSTTLMFCVASRAATPDAPLIFFSTMSLALFVAGVTRRPSGESGLQDHGVLRDFPERTNEVILMYIAMGIAVLAKGPVGMILPCAVIGMSLLIRRLPAAPPSDRPAWQQAFFAIFRTFSPLHFLRTCLCMRLGIGLAVVCAVALPWYLWVHIRSEGAWTSGFFLTHNVERAMRAMDGHGGGPFFYPAALLAGFFPWSIFWFAAIREAIRLNRAHDPIAPGAVLALCWVGVYVGLFSLAKTQLPSYITPCYPGLALLTGLFLDRWSRQLCELSAPLRRLAFGSMIAVGVLVTVALPIASRLLLPGEELLGLVGLIPLIGGAIALWQAESHRPLLACRWMAGTALAFALVLFAGIPPRIDRHRQVDELVQAIYHGEAVDRVDVASFGGPESSWVFYARQPIVALSTIEEVQDFLATSTASGKRKVVLARAKTWPQMPDQLPSPALDIARVPYFMQRDDILVITAEANLTQSAGLPQRDALR